MNNKSRYSSPSFRDHDFPLGRSERYRGMPERLSYEQILRSRSTVSFDRGRPYDSPSMLRESEQYGRGIDESRYGYDPLRQDPNHLDRRFRPDTNSRLNPLYSERELMERERLFALQNRNSRMSEDSFSSYRSRLMDTSVPMPYRERVQDVDTLRKQFENHMRNEMMELSQDLPSTRLGSQFDNSRLRHTDVEQNELLRDSQLRNSQIKFANVGNINENSLSRDLSWDSKKTPTEFLGGAGNYPFPVGVGVNEIPPENCAWEDKRTFLSENRMQKIDQSVPLSGEKLKNVEIPFSAAESMTSQTREESSQLSIQNSPVITAKSSGAEPNVIDVSEKINNDSNNPVYSNAYLKDFVCHEPEPPAKNANTTIPSNEDSSQIVAKEDPKPFEQYPVYSIPFLGETVSTLNKETAPESKDEKVLSQVKNEDDDSILSNGSHSKSGENDKMKSTLEDALETLMLTEPIVGLDFIIEYKDIVSSDGGFPFYCNLCKSSISRSLIIDHVKGFKHGLNYLKIKNENASEYVLNHIKIQEEKEEYVYKAMYHLEKTFGKGSVVVKLKSLERKQSPLQISFGKVPADVSSPGSGLEESSTIKPLTLSNIEISQGDSSIKEENPSCSSQQNSNSVKKEPEEDDGTIPITERDRKNIELDEKVSENKIAPNQENKVKKRPADNQLVSEQVKMSKTEVSENLRSKNSSAEEIKQSNFDGAILDKLTQCNITNEDDANVVRKVVETLLKLLLQYNLRHIAAEDRMKLINEVQARPFQTMGKLQELLKVQSPSEKEDDKLRLNSDFSIRGKNLAFSPATQPTVSTSVTKSPMATDSSSVAQPPSVQTQPIQNQDLPSYPAKQGNVNHPPNKLPLPLPNSLSSEKPPPKDPIPPPPFPPLGRNISVPPPPPPLPPEPPVSRPPLPPAPSKTIPMPPSHEMKNSTLPPPMAPSMGSSAYFPSPYQMPNMYAGVTSQLPSNQSNHMLLSGRSSVMQSVGGMLVPTTGNMMSPHFMAIPTGIMPDPSSVLLSDPSTSRLTDQTGFLPNPMLPSHRYGLLHPPPLPPS